MTDEAGEDVRALVDGADPGDVEEWKAAFLWFLKKLTYEYEKPLVLPKGTKIEAEIGVVGVERERTLVVSDCGVEIALLRGDLADRAPVAVDVDNFDARLLAESERRKRGLRFLSGRLLSGRFLLACGLLQLGDFGGCLSL